uniref:Uncharacterized protein n=1 Tax=Caenorhabditis japonica TaxID=281687 RepID=A0A2Q4T4U3_CAEJA
MHWSHPTAATHSLSASSQQGSCSLRSSDHSLITAHYLSRTRLRATTSSRDHRRPSDVCRLLDAHCLVPTNQDRAADQSAPARNLLERPRPFRRL